MRKPRYVHFNGIKIEPRVFEAAVLSGGISIGFDDAVPYLAEYPWMFDEEGPIAPLHECTWDYLKGGIRPRKPGEVIHHIDGDKLNCTIENLGIGDRSAHGLAHALKRQRFTPRKRWRLDGFYRPRAEAPVRELGFIEELRYREQLMAREAQRAAQAARLRDWMAANRAAAATRPSSPARQPLMPMDRDGAEAVLALALQRLRHELDHLDSGERIPPPARRPSRRDRLLEIGRIRRGCTPGEAALVRLLVKHQFDIVAAAEEVKIAVEVVNDMRKGPAVDLAIRNWRQHRRLPPACSPQNLRPYRGLGGR